MAGVIVTKEGKKMDGTKGGLFIGDRHSKPSGGIKVITEDGSTALVEDSEPIIIPSAVNNPKKKSFDGKKMTAKEILDQINTSYGGVNIKKKGGVIDKEQEKIIEQRWDKKKDSISTLSDNIQSLRYNVSTELKSDNEKVFLTALVIKLMDITAERVGNNESASNGHYGITGLKKSHVKIAGNKITLQYIGKSGVEHEKSFTDASVVHYLKKAINKSPSTYIFTTTDNFKVNEDRVNDYDGIEENIKNEPEILKNEMPEKQLISDFKVLCHESFNGYDFLVTFSDLKKQIIINAFHLKTGSRDFDTYNYDEISNATNIEHKLKNDILFILGNESKVFGKEANIKSENKQLDPAKPEQATAKEFKYYKGVNNAYKNAYELNRAIEELLDTKESGFTSEEKVFMSSYSGYGGLDKIGKFSQEELKTILYEFYTPRKVVEKMWGLAYKHGFKGGSIIEPASGIGEFIRLAPDKTLVTGYEINPYSAKIAKVLYPETTIINAAFETLFIKNNASIKNKIQGLKKYSLVIGNPPYGKFGGKYAGMGEDNYTKAENYIEYFITRGLDLLESGGLLIMIIGAEVANGASTFLQKGISKTKKEIMNKAILVDAYRLPNGVFERTDVLSDIIVLRKK